MTNPLIAAAFIQQRLKNIIPDYDELRHISGIKLTEARCQKIAELVIELLESHRQGYVDILTDGGVDVT